MKFLTGFLAILSIASSLIMFEKSATLIATALLGLAAIFLGITEALCRRPPREEGLAAANEVFARRNSSRGRLKR